MSTPILYGFGGYKESGKDAAAEHLVRAHGFAVSSMSAPIDAAARILNPVITHDESCRPVHYVEFTDVFHNGDFTEAKKHPEFRRFLKALGADFGRAVNENLWVNKMDKEITTSIGRGVPFALTGVRFPNEIQLVRDLGGVLVWISRPGIEGPADAHSTESSVSSADFDVVINNDGTLEDLHAAIEQLHQGKAPEQAKR